MVEEKNNPSYKCAAYQQMTRSWQYVQDVSQGTLHLRDSRTTYLPREPQEQPDAYGIRIQRAIFFNAFERTLHGLVGMVFRKDPQLSADVPELIRGREGAEGRAENEGYWENIDNAGTHGVVFAKEVFTDAMRDGHAAILVDMPLPLSPEATLADERASGRRPYWVSYRADQIINWRTTVVHGQTKLDLLVLREQSCEPDGEYGEVNVTRYRVLRPGSWELYKEIKDSKTGLMTIAPDPETPGGPTSLTEIPVAILYSRKTGILRSRPPLLDLALINIAHFQKYSDLSIYLHLCKPILWFRGRDLSKQIEPIGPYTFFDVDSQNGNVAFAEPTGAALGASREDLIDLEQRMSVLGLSLLSRKTPTPTTATEEILSSVKEASDLATAARSLHDALELALTFTARYLDPAATSGGSVELGATATDLTLSPQELQVYSNQVAARQLSLETMWAVMGRAGKLPEDFDPESERSRIEAGAELMADKMLSAFERGDTANY